MSADRRLERELLARYESVLDRIADEVDDSRFDLAVELARLPEQVRGYGPVKSAARRAHARRSRVFGNSGPRRRHARCRRAQAPLDRQQATPRGLPVPPWSCGPGPTPSDSKSARTGKTSCTAPSANASWPIRRIRRTLSIV